MGQLEGNSIFLKLLFLTVLSCTVKSDFTYIAISPKVIRPHSTYNLMISVEQALVPINFEIAILTENNNETIIKEKVQIQPKTSIIVPLKIDKLIDETYNLTLKAEDESQKASFDHGLLHVDQKQFSTLIQSDKPIYKPGETVQFRVMLVDRYLKPAHIEKGLDIEIYDSQRNVIKSWKNVQPQNLKYGFFKERILLSKEPNLGEWSIEVSQGEQNRQTHSFQIDQYVLPKFKVEIKPTPNFVTYNDSKFTLDISSTYTHGKSVKGRCTVILKPLYFFEIFDVNGEEDLNDSNTNKKPKNVAKTTEIDGKATMEFDFKTDLHIKPEDATEYGNDFVIEASCLEQVSGKVQNASVNIKLYKYPYKITVAEQPQSYKPGFPFQMILKIATQDDIPITDSKSNALKIHHGFAYSDDDAVFYKPIPPSGLVSMTFFPPTNELLYVNGLEVTYKELTEFVGVPSRHVSPTKSYMQLLYNKKMILKAGDILSLTVKINKPFNALHYVLIARGVIVKWERVSFPQMAIKQLLNVPLTPESAPEANLIVYTVLSQKNDVVVENLKLKIQYQSQKQLHISLSETTLEPGADVFIKCAASVSNSLIALRAVDQSVLLLKEEQDITESSLRNIEQEFDNQLSNHKSWGGSDAFQIFESGGLNILTNAVMKKNEYYPIHFKNRGYGYGFSRNMAFKAAPVAMASSLRMEDAAPAPGRGAAAFGRSFSNAGGNSGGGGGRPDIRIRKTFPETWFFMEEETLDGNLTVQKTVPDTITSWIINGFQISPEEGFGLSSSSSKLTVFRPFFITLNVPYSVIKGEIFSLQVLVYNYMESKTDVSVFLNNSENAFQFVEEEEKNSGTKQISVEPSSVSVLSFLITPTKIGTISLDLKAVANNAGDGLSQPLIVKPPGVKQSRNNAIFLNLLNEHSKTSSIAVVFPEILVPGSETLKISVIGDILGGTIMNLDQLIQLPRGCGEQNMLNFVPDIVVLDYLNVTDSLSPDIKKKTVQFLETGYQQELTYKRYDGSFSAFGNSDTSGSTWLTAFVIRSFISAKRYISIDDSVISLGLEFLSRQQAENGSFIEEGYIHDLALQGGAGGNPYALTAFTLLTFADAQKALPDPEKFNCSSIILAGVTFLTGDQDKINDNYAINLITYLLHLLNHPLKDEFFKIMEDRALTDSKTDLKYWKSHVKQKSHEDLIFYYPWEYRVKPASVEMTSYALLTHLIREGGQVKESIPIARWLLKQRNAAGGFLSTQDTVVGLTALAKFAKVTQTPSYEMNVKVSWGSDANDPSSSYTFYIGKDNTTTLQEYFIPLTVKSVDVIANGVGTALAQLSWTYYTINAGNSSGFSLDVKVEPKDKNRRLEMLICASYIAGEKSNMVILEVNTPTGYSFDSEELIKLKNDPKVMRHETEDQDTKLNIYFNFLSSIEECVKIAAHRIHLVAKHSKSSVLIYDYYDTTRKAQRFYDGPQVDVCQICSLDDSCKIKNCV